MKTCLTFLNLKLMRDLSILLLICLKTCLKVWCTKAWFTKTMICLYCLLKQMSLCDDENLGNLKLAYKNKTLFDKDLKTETFLLILEILKNLSLKKTFQKSLPSGKKVKKYKKVLKTLLNSEKSIEKRKKKFVKAKKHFKSWLRSVIKQFFKHCLVSS